MILESKIRLCTRPRSPETPSEDEYLLCASLTIAAVVRLTFIRVERNVEHEREEVLQKLGVVVGKMQTFAVFSGGTESRINNSRQRKQTSRVTGKTAPTSVPETRVLRTRRSWGAATAYLQSRNRR